MGIKSGLGQLNGTRFDYNLCRCACQVIDMIMPERRKELEENLVTATRQAMVMVGGSGTDNGEYVSGDDDNDGANHDWS